MKGDFTRFTHHPDKHYNRVLKQQGRVDLDADWNAQGDITAHLERTEATDVIGACGVPEHSDGFKIEIDAADPTALTFTPGRIYVDGILGEHQGTTPLLLTDQPDLEDYVVRIDGAGVYRVYADLWERHVTYIEDEDIREVALGGPDTTTRLKTICQVKAIKANNGSASDAMHCPPVTPPGLGALYARAEEPADVTDLCAVPAGAGYRGLENRLYRVEIHTPGDESVATFKWSRDNGAVVLPVAANGISASDKDEVTLKHLGFDDVLTVKKDYWVEVLGDETELAGNPGTLTQVDDVDSEDLKLTLVKEVYDDHGSEAHLKVRRWDHHATDDVALSLDGAVPVSAAVGVSTWYPLEDGVEVQFQAGEYQTGDYWLISARTLEGDILWPPPGETENFQPRHGIEHHYCTLAMARWDGSEWTEVHDCRPMFPALTELCALLYAGGDGQEASPVDFKLPYPLRVRVMNGRWPIPDQTVRFTIIDGPNGELRAAPATALPVPPTELLVTTNGDGLAECYWTLDPDVFRQRVEAVLLDCHGSRMMDDEEKQITVHVIHFNAGIAQDIQCHDFLDEQRADGIVQNDNGKLGFVVSKVDDLKIDYTGGIAYVRGCRLEITGGQVIAEASTTHQTLLVNELGEVVLVSKGPLPDKYAPIAFISTYKGNIKRIVDARFDLTHLDEKVEANLEKLTARRHDRRPFVPLLAFTLPHLRYHDGRNYNFHLLHDLNDVNSIVYPDALVFDGKSVWVANRDGDVLLRIPKDAREDSEVEKIPVGHSTHFGAYDGEHVWFTATTSDTDSALRINPDNPQQQERIAVGIGPKGIAFDDDFIWVANEDSATVSVIDVDTCRVVRTISLKFGEVHMHPSAVVFDGEYIWVGGSMSPACLFAIKKPWGDPEHVPLRRFPGRASTIASMAFDGSHLWVTRDGGRLTKIDVITGEEETISSPLSERLGNRSARVSLVFDGSAMWHFSEGWPSLIKLDADTGSVIGSIVQSDDSITPERGVFDGTHLWYSLQRGNDKLVRKTLVG